ncbi:MAG: transposase [Planctomycetota bacterium]|nr:transposase [Planctomycetota bacterium]
MTDKLLAATVKLMMGRRRIVRRAAADSTGLEAEHRSAYFVRRKARGQKEAKNPLYQTSSYTRFPKLSVVVDCDNHMILSVLVGTGPKPDINDLQGLLGGLPSGVAIRTLLADAGYDSEPNHKYLREEHGIRSVIPAKHGRPGTKGRNSAARAITPATARCACSRWSTTSWSVIYSGGLRRSRPVPFSSPSVISGVST